jgi:hypothetical protein
VEVPPPEEPKKKKSRKSIGDTTTTKKKASDELPVELAGFKYEFKDKLICEEEVNTKSGKEQTLQKVARWIVICQGKPNEKRFDLLQFSSAQLRRLALNFGCKGAGTLSKYDCRLQMALRKDGGVIKGPWHSIIRVGYSWH